MPVIYHLQPILHFLDELEQYNNKTWFDLHRLSYTVARESFEKFINDIIDEFRASDNLQGLSAKDCITRIYRDLRFTKDKTPYKTNMAALIGPGGWRASWLGYYVSIEPHGKSLVAGGLYGPTPDELNRFRQVIAEDAAAFKKIMHARDFIEMFKEVEGSRLKTAPRGFDKTHPEIKLLQLKQITAMHYFSDEEVLADDFAEQVIHACRSMRPFLDYLRDILH